MPTTTQDDDKDNKATKKDSGVKDKKTISVVQLSYRINARRIKHCSFTKVRIVVSISSSSLSHLQLVPL
eukprot:556453-Ditylum_brightwellii.AAC.1